MLVGDRGGFSSSDGKALAGDSESDNVTRRHCVAGFTAAATAPDRGYSSTLATWTPLRVRRRRCEVLPVGRRFRNPPRGSSAVAVSAAGASRVADSGSPPGLSMLSGGASTASSSSCAASSVFSASSAASGSASSPLAVFLRRRRRCLGFFGFYLSFVAELPPPPPKPLKPNNHCPAASRLSQTSLIAVPTISAPAST